MKKYLESNEYVLPALVLSVALFLASIVGGYSFYKARVSKTLTVTGSAEKIVASDTVKWMVNINESVGANGLSAGSAQMQKDLSTVRLFLLERGVTEKEVTAAPMSVQTVCANQNSVMYGKFGDQSCSGGPAGYSLQQTITIESNRVKEVTALAEEAAQKFLAQGMVFSTSGIEYYYNKLGDLRLDLIAEATKNAQDRARRIAESTGARIGSVQTASTGVFQVTARNSVDVSDYGVYDTQAIEKKVTAVVRATFGIR